MKYLATSLSCLLMIGLLATCKRKESIPPVPPVASFTCVGPLGAGDSTRFTNASTNATSYKWNFGDGGIATTVTPAHVYKQQGQYIVNLEATNGGGSNLQTKTITIYSPPAGSTCNCKVVNSFRTRPSIRLPDKIVLINSYGVSGILFEGINYDLTNSSTTSNSYRSASYFASTGGEAIFVKTTDSLRVSYHSGGIGNPTFADYYCKRQR